MPKSPENSHKQWINYALALAERALPEDVPVGAVIVNKAGDILGEGWNQREKNNDPGGHAEMMALQNAGKALNNWRMESCTLYVTLEPCPMCASALLQARIAVIVFGTSDPLQGALGSALNLLTLHQSSTKVIGGVLEDLCQAQLHEFFKARRY